MGLRRRVEPETIPGKFKNCLAAISQEPSGRKRARRGYKDAKKL